MGIFSLLLIVSIVSATNLIPNGDFEARLQNWSSLWTRDAGAGTLAIDEQVFHSGKFAARIEHRGAQDWSFSPNKSLMVKEGDLFTLDAWVKGDGEGSAEICAITYDANGTVIEWAFGGSEARGTYDWKQLQSRFFIPRGVARIQPRIIGYGPATVWVDDFQLTSNGNIQDYRGDLPAQLKLENSAIQLSLSATDGLLSVTDSRTGHVWNQQPYRETIVLKTAKIDGRRMETTWFYAAGKDISIQYELDESRPECAVTLTGEGSLPQTLPFPHPFVTPPGTYLAVPMNEGISYPVDDASIEPMTLVAYGGHGICMPFWGATDGERGYLAIFETPNDASIRITRLDHLLCVVPQWEDQKGDFSYPRKIRYVFFDQGGHVAICKRYREYAKETGLLKTLEQKRTEIPSVDRLIGAVNVWCWDNALNYVKEMQSLGIERILWSNRESASTIQAMNEMGILTSRYDIYQDVMNPENFQYLSGVHPDWTTAGWPKDLMLDENGDWRKGWEVEGKNGKWYPCGVLCDKQAISYARDRISDELKTRAYQCRFIDTTTASPWRECYHPDHPLTRSESRFWKMELLRLVSEEFALVCGSETGHDAAVPYVHYFEGMLSLGPYRVPDAGRDMQKLWDEVPENVAKFQLGHKYRLPLWELVYHDCVVAQWYWGDYNNKLPSLWDKRDLFNVLYGTPPMFMFNKEIWRQYKDRFVQSYKNTCPVVCEVGYSEMTGHRFLTPDRDVQQTRFANGIAVTVNFGKETFPVDEKTELPAMSYRVDRETPSQCDDWKQR